MASVATRRPHYMPSGHHGLAQPPPAPSAHSHSTTSNNPSYPRRRTPSSSGSSSSGSSSSSSRRRHGSWQYGSIPYQVRYSCNNLGKRIHPTKRHVSFTFGFANLSNPDAYGPECRGEEYTVELSWSVTSRKHIVKFDGHIVHRGYGGGASKGLYEGSLMHTFEVKRGPYTHIMQVIAYAMPPNRDVYATEHKTTFRKKRARQFDFRLDGLSFFDFYHIYQLNGRMPGARSCTTNQTTAAARTTPSFQRNAPVPGLNAIQEEDDAEHPKPSTATPPAPQTTPAPASAPAPAPEPTPASAPAPAPAQDPPTVVLLNLPSTATNNTTASTPPITTFPPTTTTSRRNSDAASVMSYASSSMLSFRPPTWEEQMEYDQAYLDDEENYYELDQIRNYEREKQQQHQHQQPQPQDEVNEERQQRKVSIGTLGLDNFATLHQAFQVDRSQTPNLIDFDDDDDEEYVHHGTNFHMKPITSTRSKQEGGQEDDLIDLSGLDLGTGSAANPPTPFTGNGNVNGGYHHAVPTNKTAYVVSRGNVNRDHVHQVPQAPPPPPMNPYSTSPMTMNPPPPQPAWQQRHVPPMQQPYARPVPPTTFVGGSNVRVVYPPHSHDMGQRVSSKGSPPLPQVLLQPHQQQYQHYQQPMRMQPPQGPYPPSMGVPPPYAMPPHLSKQQPAFSQPPPLPRSNVTGLGRKVHAHVPVYQQK